MVLHVLQWIFRGVGDLLLAWPRSIEASCRGANGCTPEGRDCLEETCHGCGGKMK